jgi:hypothetical protein
MSTSLRVRTTRPGKRKRKKQKLSVNQIRRFKLRTNIPAKYLIRLMDVGQTSYYAWQARTRYPTLINALKLSAGLQCPIEVLFADLFRDLRSELAGRVDNVMTQMQRGKYRARNTPTYL